MKQFTKQKKLAILDKMIAIIESTDANDRTTEYLCHAYNKVILDHPTRFEQFRTLRKVIYKHIYLTNAKIDRIKDIKPEDPIIVNNNLDYIKGFKYNNVRNPKNLYRIKLLLEVKDLVKKLKH